IGPGLGALTKLALEKGARVLTIEKDTRLASFLRERLVHPRLEVLNTDALNFDVQILFSHRGVKLLANLPYNISSQLLLKFVKYLSEEGNYRDCYAPASRIGMMPLPLWGSLPRLERKSYRWFSGLA